MNLPLTINDKRSMATIFIDVKLSAIDIQCYIDFNVVIAFQKLVDGRNASISFRKQCFRGDLGFRAISESISE